MIYYGSMTKMDRQKLWKINSTLHSMDGSMLDDDMLLWNSPLVEIVMAIDWCCFPCQKNGEWLIYVCQLGRVCLIKPQQLWIPLPHFMMMHQKTLFMPPFGHKQNLEAFLFLLNKSKNSKLTLTSRTMLAWCWTICPILSSWKIGTLVEWNLPLQKSSHLFSLLSHLLNICGWSQRGRSPWLSFPDLLSKSYKQAKAQKSNNNKIVWYHKYYIYVTEIVKTCRVSVFQFNSMTETRWSQDPKIKKLLSSIQLND